MGENRSKNQDSEHNGGRLGWERTGLRTRKANTMLEDLCGLKEMYQLLGTLRCLVNGKNTVFFFDE